MSKNSKLLRKFRYSFEAYLEEVRINVKFPCRISCSWNYGEGEAKTISAKPLVNGVAEINDKLHFSVLIGYEEEAKRYLEHKSTLEITLITDNGSSLAGFVSLDLGNIVSKKESNKEIYDIERCPDKSAHVKMRVSYRYLSEAPGGNIANRVNNKLDEEELDAFDNRSFTPRSEYVPKTEYMKKPPLGMRDRQKEVTTNNQYAYNQSPRDMHINIPTYGHNIASSQIVQTPTYQMNTAHSSIAKHNSTSMNRDLIEREMQILKTRASEFESKFKNERFQKEKISEALKSKEEIYFTIKTEVQRKEIEIEVLNKNIQSYKHEYDSLKGVEEKLRKQCEKLEYSLESTERSFSERIMKLETDLSHLEKKYEKSQLDIEKTKIEKENAVKAVKKELEDVRKQKEGLAETVKANKKEKDEMMRSQKLEKDNTDRTIRELNKENKEFQDTINSLKEKIATFQKKVVRSEETRNEDLQKYSAKITEIERLKETLTVELEDLRTGSAKKEQTLNETIRVLEIKYNQQKNSATKLKSLVNEMQLERTTLQKELAQYKQTSKALEELVQKTDKQLISSKTQCVLVTEQLQSKSSEAKALSSKVKDLSEEIPKLQAKHEEAVAEIVAEHNSKFKELKKAEEAKLLAVNKQLAKKTQEYDQSHTREQKLTLQIQQMREELAKAQAMIRDKADQFKKQDAQFKSELSEAHKKFQRREEVLGDKINQITKELEQSQYTAKQYVENIERLNIKEQRLKQEIAELQAEIQEAMFFKQESDNKEMKLRELESKIDALEEELALKEQKESNTAKLLSDTKEKLLEVEMDRTKKENQLKEKEKTIAALNKQAQIEAEERRKDQLRKEQDHKNQVEDLKESLRREKAICEELRMQLEKAESNIQSVRSSNEKFVEKIEKLSSEIKLYKENEKYLLEEKETTIRNKEECELQNRELEKINSMLESDLSSKDRELKDLVAQNTVLLSSYQQLEKMLQRNSLISSEISEYVVKLQSIINSNSTGAGLTRDIKQSSSTHQLLKDATNANSVSEYDKLLEIRRTLVVVESRWRKEAELSIQRQLSQGKMKEFEEKQTEKMVQDYQRSKAELTKIKKQFEDLTYENNYIRGQNQELSEKIQRIESELLSLRTTYMQTEARLKESDRELLKMEEESVKAQQRHETTLEEVRNDMLEKVSKQKKEMTATIRKLQMRVEELEEKNFSLELENQKLVELPKREEEIKKLIFKTHELEKNLSALNQDSQQKTGSLQSRIEELEWEKKNMEETTKHTISKLEKNVATLQSEVESTNLRYKEQAGLIREKDAHNSKGEEIVKKLQHQVSSLSYQLQEQKDRFTNLDTRTRADIAKYKSEVVSLKNTLETEREKLYAAEEMKIVKASLEEQLKTKEAQLAQLSAKEQRVSEELFRLTQKLEDMKWEYEQKLEAKDNQIMSIQEMMYNMNSKENIRVLKEQETNQKMHQLDVERRQMNRQVQEYKMRMSEYEEKIRILVQERRQLQDLLKQRRDSSEGLRYGSPDQEKYVITTQEQDIQGEMMQLRKKIQLQMVESDGYIQSPEQHKHTLFERNNNNNIQVEQVDEESNLTN